MKKLTITSVSVAVLLSACGGGGGSSSSNTNTGASVKSVKVVGASLSDSGTFGFKFTVQPKETYKVYTELVAAKFGMASFCPAYAFNGTTFVAGASGCTNYAVAGAKVNNYVSGSSPVEVVPTSIVKQLSDVGAAGFTANDLLIVGEASSNDAAALATAYLTDVQYYGAGHPELATAFANLLGSLSVSGTFADASTSGVAYMRALADKLVAAVETNALAKGAPRVAIVNTLDITKTPRFTKVLGDVSAANGGGPTGDAAAASVQQLVQAWITAYNTQLTSKVAASSHASKIAVVDMYSDFNDQMSNLGKYSLVNTSATVCDEIVNKAGTKAPGVTALGVDATGQAVVAACTGTEAAALNLNSTTNGWQQYLFADSFHPTPYGHELLSRVYLQAFTTKSWN